MAQNVAVVRGNLPSTAAGTVDLTSSGFGTVGAAIIIACNANATNNPEDDSVLMMGFWDGTNQRAVGVWEDDGQTTTVIRRTSSATRGLLFDTGSAANEWTVSAVTDGIRLTLDVDNTGVERFVTAILIRGVDVDLRTFTPNSTQDATASVTGLSSAPVAVVFLSIAHTTNETVTHAIFSFGVCVNDGSQTQRSIIFGNEHGQTTTDNTLLFSESRVCGQVFNNATSWTGEITSFAPDGWTMTTRDGGSGSDIVFALTLGGDASVEIGTLTTPAATGNDTISMTDDPDALLVALSTATGTTRHDSGDATEGVCFGLSDGTNDYAHNSTSLDGGTTSNTRSAASATAIIDLDSANASTFNDEADATVSSFGTGEAVLNYSAVPATATKGLWMAFTTAAAAGTTIPRGLSKVEYGHQPHGIQGVGAGIP